MRLHHLLAPLIFGVFTQSSLAAELAHDEFLKAYFTPFIQQTCSEKGIFMRCFTIAQEECTRGVTQAYEICQKDIARRMPEKIRSKHDAGYWGAQLSWCTSRRFSKTRKEQLNDKQPNCKHLVSRK